MFILDGDRLFLTIHHLSMCSLRHLGVPWHTDHVIQTLEGRMCIHQKMIDSQKVIQIQKQISTKTNINESKKLFEHEL